MWLAKLALAVVNLLVSRLEAGEGRIRRHLPNHHRHSWLEQHLPISSSSVDSHLSGRRYWMPGIEGSWASPSQMCCAVVAPWQAMLCDS